MIKFNNINKWYKGESNNKQILDSFSYNMPDKGIICILGVSGCGKTTLINIVAGIVKSDSGTINGIENIKVSYMFQEDRLLPWISAIENILAVNNNKNRCIDVIKSVGLYGEEYKKPGSMSGGMRQRVALARALAFGGDLYLMDEPFKGVDTVLKNSLMELVRKSIQGKLCIFVTHDIEEAATLSDIILITEGPPLKIKKEITCNEYKDKNHIMKEIRRIIIE